MDFRNYLAKAAKEIEKEEKKILARELKEAGKKDKKLIPLIRIFIKACKGGKRIRGALVKMGFELANGKSKEIIKISAAYEIMHTSILAHDDIMDESLLRRGRPSLYQALGGGRYGISQSIALADYGFFLSFKIICDADFSPQLKNKVLSLFSKILTDTCLGQMLDVMGERSFTVMKLKTARYTISGPLQIGAILAGAKEQLVKKLDLAGEYLGIAYQIKDDILDSEVSEEKEAGKYIKKALEILPKSSKLLQQLAEYLINRTK